MWSSFLHKFSTGKRDRLYMMNYGVYAWQQYIALNINLLRVFHQSNATFSTLDSDSNLFSNLWIPDVPYCTDLLTGRLNHIQFCIFFQSVDEFIAFTHSMFSNSNIPWMCIYIFWISIYEVKQSHKHFILCRSIRSLLQYINKVLNNLHFLRGKRYGLWLNLSLSEFDGYKLPFS